MAMDHDITRDGLVAQAEATKAILVAGSYRFERGVVHLQELLDGSHAGTRLVRPEEWDDILRKASTQCLQAQPAQIMVTAESTVAALERLAGAGRQDVGALNFASARRPGGGWDTGSRAQEESLARASGLTASLAAAPGYYTANRQHEHLFYTDHAIWSPAVPFFARDDGSLLEQPFTAGIITMPAPNLGGMSRLSEGELRSLPDLWLKRIRCVLALSIIQKVQHLVLGAWGCGAFGNDPILVARSFKMALAPSDPWLHGFETITFAILDHSRHQSCRTAFTAAFAPLEAP
jgi:uncharacterized protein (TIGR02452 family)